MELHATRNGQRKKLTFFDLPTEIRDLVYDNLKVTKYSIPLKTDDRPFAYIDTLTPHCRLINRRFKMEAAAQISESATLVLKDRSGEGCGPPTRLRNLGWPWCLEAVAHLYAELHLGCDGCETRCVVSRGLFHDLDWLEQFLMNLPNLKTVDVKAYVLWQPQCAKIWREGPGISLGDRGFCSTLRRAVEQVSYIKSFWMYKHVMDAEHSESRSIHGRRIESWVYWNASKGWQATNI